MQDGIDLFLKEKCPEAAVKFAKARNTILSGWAILGGTGFGLVPVYVPCLCVGYHQQKKAIEYFNNNCNPEYAE